jgi:hypothetical protein
MSLPVLDSIRIASPCTADWDQMTGDDRVRFCKECNKNVFNLSEMTREEAQKLLTEHTGRLCLRLYRRPDGTVLTADCPVGLARVRQRLQRMCLAGLALVGAFFWGSLTALGWSVGRQNTINGATAESVFGRWFGPRPIRCGPPALGGCAAPPMMGKVAPVMGVTVSQGGAPE